MKKILIVLTLIVSSTVLAQDWTTYENKDFNFSVDLPGEPKMVTQEVPTEVGDLTMNMFMVDASTTEESSDNLIYMVIYTKYPMNQDEVDESKIETMLDGSVDGAVANVQGKLVYANKVALNGSPGRAAKIEVQGAFMYMNMYLKDSALYAVQTICLVENDENDDINKFFDSFKLNNM
jgi:hypothetical protein